MIEVVIAAVGLSLLGVVLVGFLTLRRRQAARRRQSAVLLENVRLSRLAYAAVRAMLDEARRGLPPADRAPR